jgi:hypothetical protein
MPVSEHGNCKFCYWKISSAAPFNYGIRVEPLRPFCAIWMGKMSAMNILRFLSAVIPFTAKSLK